MASMRTVLVSLLLCLGGPTATLAAISGISKTSNVPVVANKYILEVDSLSSIPGKRDGLSAHEHVYNSLKARGIRYKVDKEYDTDIFVGAAVTLEDSKDVVAMSETAGVKAAHPVHIHPRPKPVHWEPVSEGSMVDTQSSHIMTGVDKLHAEGFSGKGIRIGILDTGIDYTHPALGGGFGSGFKVEGGYDLVGDDYTGYNEPVPDDDPLDQCAGHGTHVAGIIGADPENAFNISGVAYESDLTMYRIFGCDGSVQDDVIVDALIMGYKAGLDVISLSLGGADGWTESASSVVASAIAKTGVIVTISAGNSGDSGSWYTSSPGNGIDVISVASVDNIAIALQNATVGGVEHDPITYYETFPWPYADPFPVYATSNDTTVVDDACDPLPDDTPDLSGFLVIVRRGTCTFVQKLANVADKGGDVVFIYDNGSGFAGIEVGEYNASLIQSADGEFLVEQYASGVPVTITFPQSGGSYEFPDPNGGLVSSFTSYGPSNDFYFKPAIGAPGGNILSTLPTTQGSYGILSGTSMAAPFVAGVSALLLEADKSAGKKARTLFETTATKVPVDNTGGDVYQTLTQQGAGLIDAYYAIHPRTLVSPGELILNDTANFKGEHKFTVTNEEKKTKHYKLTHVPAGTAMTVKPNDIFTSLGPVPLDSAHATVKLSSSEFTLKPGQSRTISASFRPPKGLDAAQFPVYSGWIEIASGSDLTHVSYLGLAAALKNKQVLDTTDYLFGFNLPVVLNAVGDVQTETTNYTFMGDDWPAFAFSLVFGTPNFKLDLVSADATLDKGALKIKPVGTLVEYKYMSRTDEYEVPVNTFGLEQPVFADGTVIPNGSYRFLAKALKVTGNPKKSQDWEAWLSPIVNISA